MLGSFWAEEPPRQSETFWPKSVRNVLAKISQNRFGQNQSESFLAKISQTRFGQNQSETLWPKSVRKYLAKISQKRFSQKEATSMVARVDSYRKQNITRSNSNPDHTIRDNFCTYWRFCHVFQKTKSRLFCFVTKRSWHQFCSCVKRIKSILTIRDKSRFVTNHDSWQITRFAKMLRYFFFCRVFVTLVSFVRNGPTYIYKQNIIVFVAMSGSRKG